MELAKEDKVKIEGEEKQKLEEQNYREEVRDNLNKEKAKKTSKSWMILLLFPLIVGVLMLNSKTSTNNSDTQKKENVPTPTIAITEEYKQNLADNFCEQRSKPNVRAVNFEDYIAMNNQAPKEVTLHPANGVYPTVENCKMIAQICLDTWTKEECKNIADMKIWIGMSNNELILSWGLPSDRNNSTYSFGTNSQWVYGNPIYGASYVYLEGKDNTSMKVTSWQD